MRYEQYVGELDYVKNGHKPFGRRFVDANDKVQVASPRTNHFCKDCVLYYKNLHQRGVTQKEFPLICKFDRRLDRNSITRDMFETEEQYELAWSSLDPVTWGNVMLGYEPRWYQEEAAACSSQFKAFRWGRRSGKSDIISLIALWSAFTKKNYSVLVICPYESQVDLLFKKIQALVEKNNEVNESCKIKQSPPHEITFKNGSNIIGFSAGAKSSARSDKIRGQGANLVIFDEADFIADDDIEVVMATLADQSDTNMIFSSTPTGARRGFFKNCTDKDGRYKEFHFISAESPRWTETAEFELRSKYSDGGFQREFNAEFGIELEGVFRGTDIDACLRSYCLADQKRSMYEGWKITMGVDWNKITGTHLVIIGRHPNKAHYKVLDKVVIKRQEYTQHAGVKAIVELDAKWKCDFIFVDEGYGAVQVEMLHKMDEWAGTSFKRRLEAVALGGNQEIISPIDGQLTKKPTKGLMVNLTAKIIEAHSLELPKEEDTSQQIIDSEIPYLDIGIVQQMRNYKVEKISPTGRLTYSDDYEHTLTALMLAILAMGMKFEDYKNFRYSSRVGLIPPINKPGSEVPSQDMSGNPLPPSTVAMLREAAARAQREEQDELKKRLNDLRTPVGRKDIARLPSTNSQGEILVARNGVPVGQSIRAIGPRSFRNTRSSRKPFRRYGHRSH